MSNLWLVITFLALLASLWAFASLKKQRTRYKLGLLVLMLTGMFLMVLVDHIMGFIQNGKFIVLTTNGLIKNATVLGIVMVLSVLAVWLLAIVVPILIKNKKCKNEEMV